MYVTTELHLKHAGFFHFLQIKIQTIVTEFNSKIKQVYLISNMK